MKLTVKYIALIVFCGIITLANAQEVEGGLIGETWIASKKKADDFYDKLAYNDAIALYKRLLKSKTDATAQAKLADCYRLTGDYANAATAYNKAVEDGNTQPQTILHQAEMLQINKDYAGAAAAYQKYLATNPNDVRAQNQLNASNNVQEFSKNINRYNITNLSINTKDYDFAPTYHNENLFFSSDRDEEKGIGKIHSWLGTTFYDMYFSKGQNTEFAKPKVVKKDGETRYHDAVATFTPDDKTVYFTRNNYLDKKLSKSDEGIVKQGIFFATVDGSAWKNDQKFSYNNAQYDVAHPALSPDGNTMYFASNQPGGKGGMDLYKTTKTGDSWSTPENLSALNTEGDELFPSVNKEGILYFASNGLGGLGGLDIFRANNDLLSANNVGAPINSSYDDFGVAFSKDASIGYFTSNRLEGKGKDDIWSFKDNGINIEGIIVDAQTQEPICNSTAEVVLNGISKQKTTTECDGKFYMSAEPNKTYNFNASAENYLSNNSVTASTSDVEAGSTVYVKIPLTKNIPTAYSVTVVDNVTKNEIKDAVIEISSTTDSNKYAQKYTDENGKVCYTVQCSNDYVATAKATGYLANSTVFSTKNIDCQQTVTCNSSNVPTAVIELAKDPNSKNGNEDADDLSTQLLDIYYDFDKANIREESMPQLQKVLSFLKENPDAIVEISSHTDARAPYAYNMNLSQRRAQSVVNWLVKNGISKNRLKAVGYGETKLRNNCADNVECTEYEHQRNRRTEFKIIGGNVNIQSLENMKMDVDPCSDCPF